MNFFSKFSKSSKNKKSSTQEISQGNEKNTHQDGAKTKTGSEAESKTNSIFKIGIKKSSNAILSSIVSIFSKNKVNENMMEKVEESLILNDIDPEIVQKMLSEMKRKKLFNQYQHVTQDNQHTKNDATNDYTHDSNTETLIFKIISIAKEVARKNSKILKYYEKNHSDLFIQKVMNFLYQPSSTTSSTHSSSTTGSASTKTSSSRNSNSTSELSISELSQTNTTTAHKPYTITFIGMNGSGKTTTIAKIAHKLKKMGLNGKIICGDTFRSAATEQLIEWSKKLDIEAIHKTNTDPAALIFEGVQKNYQNNSANNQSLHNDASRNNSLSQNDSISLNDSLCDYLLIDTAGRLHTNTNLMNEMQKIERVLKKIDTSYPNESILVIDASVGQSVYEHIEQFSKYTKLTGIVVTKMDNSAKGGIIIGIASRFDIPIYYMGVGEQLDELVQFNYDDFLDELLDIPE